MNRHSAFTLIEILIVLLIISIVSGTVLLTISRRSLQNIRHFQEQFIQTLTFAKAEAILLPAIFMLERNDQAFHFFRYQADNLENKWVPVNNRQGALKDIPIPKGVEVKIDILNHQDHQDTTSDSEKSTTATEDIDESPKIIISINGDMTPFKMYVGNKGEKPQYLIANDDNGNLVSKELP